MLEKYVGDGQVHLIAGGGKIFTDIAARFVRSERPVKEIIESPYSPQIVKNILESGHGAALEFDYFIFGVEGYSRVCEVQLVRKRMASYLIKSGRQELGGKRSYNIVIPKELQDTKVHAVLQNYFSTEFVEKSYPGMEIGEHSKELGIDLTFNQIVSILEQWYDQNLEKGYKEEDLRYLKPQATEFKAIIGMNIHALRDWWKIRLCLCSQKEIRDLATKMFQCVKEVAPDLVIDAGPSCKVLGYCPEGRLQHSNCKGKIYTKDEAIRILKEHHMQNKENSLNTINGGVHG